MCIVHCEEARFFLSLMFANISSRPSGLCNWPLPHNFNELLEKSAQLAAGKYDDGTRKSNKGEHILCLALSIHEIERKRDEDIFGHAH